MKRVVLLFILFSIASLSFSQIDAMREKLDDAMIEDEQGLLSLRFFDAVNGKPLPNVSVIIESIGDFVSNSMGLVRFPIPKEDGNYTALAKKDGYITSNFKVNVLLGTIFYNRYSMSQQIPIGHIRIVLDWDNRPKDLDAHIVKVGEYHVSYRNKKISSDGMAVLDRDDTDGYGPETITVKKIDKNKKYQFFVHDYTNKDKAKSDQLSHSKAHIKIYGDNQLLHQLKVPEDTEGLYWHIFEINNGIIDIVNTITNSQQ